MTLVDRPSNSKPGLSRVRVTAIAAAAALLVLAAWYVLVLSPRYVTLYQDLRPQEASAIVDHLEAEGAGYRLANGGRAILVRENEADTLRLSAAASGVPAGGVEGFELFNESDMGLTDFAQKIRYQRAIQGELARTIMMMEGVSEARVHISIPERALFRGERRNAEAAVTLIMRNTDEESPSRIEGVQRLVAAAVPDLSASDVVVLNGRGEVINSHVDVVTQRVDAESSTTAGYVTEVLREALPYRRFAASLEQVPEELAGGDEVAGGPIQARWNISVATESSLTADEKAIVRSALEDAGVIDPTRAEMIHFRVEPGRPSTESAAGTHVPAFEESAPPPSHAQNPLWLWAGLAFSLIVAALGVGGWMMWRKRREAPLSLTFEQHLTLAKELKEGLAAEMPKARADA